MKVKGEVTNEDTSKSESTKVNLRGGVIRSSDTRGVIATRAKGSHHSSVAIATTRTSKKAKATEQAKPFEDISKGKVWQAYKAVPQGGVISPLLSNLFLHYAFDRWMSEHYPETRIVRYADDGIIHCKTRSEAEEVRETVGRRLERLGLNLHPQKTKLVYCGRHYKGRKIKEEISFDFLGYTYRSRGAKGKTGKIFTGFLPAVSSRSKRSISRRVRKWNLDKRSDKSRVTGDCHARFCESLEVKFLYSTRLNI